MDTLELIKLWKNGDKAARDKAIEKNMGLVYSIAKRFDGRGHEMEDLYQIGSLGLIKAIDNFDISYDVKFSTYAVYVITGEIKRFIRDDGIIKVSRSIKENSYKVKKAIEKIKKLYNKQATIEEIMNETFLSKEEVVMSLDATSEVESINKIIYSSEENSITIGDRLFDRRDEIEKSIDKIMLEGLLNKLDEKEYNLIKLRYFEDKTQSEVAKILGISQVQVSRLEKKILINLRMLC